MIDDAFRETVIRLPFKTAKALIQSCQREFLLPRQIIARSIGEALGEPVIFTIPQPWILPDSSSFPQLQNTLQNTKDAWRPKGDQKKIYLLLLSQIVQGMPERFSAIAPLSRGSKRIYFARNRAEVEGTGRKNKAARIPETECFASVNNDGFRKQNILSDLMRRLGFSPDYTHMISFAPCYKFPLLLGIEFRTS